MSGKSIRAATTTSKTPITLISYSHAPGFALGSGVFSSKEAAIKYASFYRAIGNVSPIKQSELKAAIY